MGWKGMAIGGFAGWIFWGPLGALFGMALGNSIEKKDAKAFRGKPRVPPINSNASMTFCATAAAMLAKMAKADGVVTKSEIASVEAAFARLGFSDSARTYAISVFRKAKDDPHTIYDYARDFASVVNSVEVRELFYELLWDIACADNKVSAAELEMLQRLPSALAINPRWFGLFASERLRDWRSSGGTNASHPQRDELADAYATLGVAPSASNDELKKAYREKAKKYHPDAIKAQGLPEELVGKATAMMAKVNAAWSTIKSARGIG